MTCELTYNDESAAEEHVQNCRTPLNARTGIRAAETTLIETRVRKTDTTDKLLHTPSAAPLFPLPPTFPVKISIAVTTPTFSSFQSSF